MKHKTIKKIVNVALTCLLVLLALLIVISVYSKISGKSLLPYTVLWVLTDSMEDAIPARSYILVKNVSAKDVEVNDVITFRSRDAAIAGSLNTHRVVEIIGDHEEFVTKGDNNAVSDSTTVLAEDVVAKYVRNLPLLTLLGRIFTSSAGFICCILLMIGGVALWFLSSFVKQRKQLSQEEMDRLVAEEVAKLEAQNASAELADELHKTNEQSEFENAEKDDG